MCCARVLESLTKFNICPASDHVLAPLTMCPATSDLLSHTTSSTCTHCAYGHTSHFLLMLRAMNFVDFLKIALYILVSKSDILNQFPLVYQFRSSDFSVVIVLYTLKKGDSRGGVRCL